MLISFLNQLYKKPIQYQLIWLYILGHIKDGSKSDLSIKKIKRNFNCSETTFYRIIRFGLFFFNKKSQVNIVMLNGFLYISSNNKTIKSKSKKASQKINTNINLDVELIINYFNKKTNKLFSKNSAQTIRLIDARINDGFLLDDFYKVIDIKSSKWLGTDMEDYLRPQTLFSTKFESYLNEKNIKENNNVSKRFTSTQKAVNSAKELNWFHKKN